MNVEYGETIKEYIADCSGNLAVSENDILAQINFGVHVISWP